MEGKDFWNEQISVKSLSPDRKAALGIVPQVNTIPKAWIILKLQELDWKEKLLEKLLEENVKEEESK